MSLYCLKHSQVPPCWIFLLHVAKVVPFFYHCEKIKIFHWLCFKQYKLSCTTIVLHTISIFRYILNFKVPLLFNRQLNVNTGEDRGGLLLNVNMGEDRGGLLLCVNMGEDRGGLLLCVNTGEDRGGLLLLDDTVSCHLHMNKLCMHKF